MQISAAFTPWSLLEGFGIQSSLASYIIPVWVFGAVIGLLLPRPKWLEGALRSSTMVFSTPPGSGFRRLALFFHGAYIVREVWYYFTQPGTFHALISATKRWMAGEGFQLPSHILATREAELVVLPAPAKAQESVVQAVPAKELSNLQDWYVTEEDLKVFKQTIEEDYRPDGVGDWEQMFNKAFSNFTYKAWRRIVSEESTDYKSVTVADNATAEEFMDFYLDDPVRTTWDQMITKHEVLENGSPEHRCQVVRWVRTFPFPFISEREYIIARRIWRENGSIYGITKTIEHPAAVDNSRIVRMDVFYSMWRSRTIPCPKGSGRPACETVLLHHEDFKIPERLARFAVRHGMGGFVKKMGPAVAEFVKQRRLRCDPNAVDLQAFGVEESRQQQAQRCAGGIPAAVPMISQEQRLRASASALSPLDRYLLDDSSDAGTDSTTAASEAGSPLVHHQRAVRRTHSAPSLKRVGHTALALCLVYAFGRSGQGGGVRVAPGSLPSKRGSELGRQYSGPGPRRRRHRAVQAIEEGCQSEPMQITMIDTEAMGDEC